MNIKHCVCCKQQIYNKLSWSIYCKDCAGYIGKLQKKVHGVYYRRIRELKFYGAGTNRECKMCGKMMKAKKYKIVCINNKVIYAKCGCGHNGLTTYSLIQVLDEINRNNGRGGNQYGLDK